MFTVYQVNERELIVKLEADNEELFVTIKGNDEKLEKTIREFQADIAEFRTVYTLNEEENNQLEHEIMSHLCDNVTSYYFGNTQH